MVFLSIQRCSSLASLYFLEGYIRALENAIKHFFENNTDQQTKF